MGCKCWFVDLEIIAQGLTKQGYEKGHYFWSMLLQKEAVAAIVQTKVESLIKNFENIEAVLLIKVI